MQSSYYPYTHKTQYYETDQMGVIHNSNYFRWFEEARTDFMERVGLPYAKMEEMGLRIAVMDSVLLRQRVDNALAGKVSDKDVHQILEEELGKEQP